LLVSEVATAFFEQVLAHANAQRLVSDENFTENGTLIEAWVGQKWFKKKRAESSDSPTDHLSMPRRFPWRAADDCHAYLDPRFRRAVVDEGGGARGWMSLVGCDLVLVRA